MRVWARDYMISCHPIKFIQGSLLRRKQWQQCRQRVYTPTYQDIRDDRVYTYFDLGPNQRKTFKVLLTASYAGSYYLPAVSCEAMYDRAVYTRKKGKVVEVIKANVNQ